jgi:hypothetical protein
MGNFTGSPIGQVGVLAASVQKFTLRTPFSALQQQKIAQKLSKPQFLREILAYKTDFMLSCRRDTRIVRGKWPLYRRG